MLPESMSGHKVIVDQYDDSDNTLKTNVMSCKMYGADYDGDEMVVIAAQNPTSLFEIEKLVDI